MRRTRLVLILSLVLLLLSLVSASVVHGQEVQFIRTFHIRSSFDCWRDEQGEWTLELGGQGAQVLGIPGESVDYIIPYPLPDELADAEMIVVEAAWDPLNPDDPYYGESIAAGEVVDVFLTEDQRLCVRVSTTLDAVIAPVDITQSWQSPPILGLRYIVPVEVKVQGAGPLAELPAGIVFSPDSSEAAEGQVRSWRNSPLSVQVSFQGEDPLPSYQLDAREYNWSERNFVRHMLTLGYSPWSFDGEEQKMELLPRSSKFLFSPDRLLVQGAGISRSIPDTSSLLLDSESDGLVLSGSVDEYESFFAGYLLPQADVRGSLDELSYRVPDYGSYAASELPEPKLPEIEGTSGLYRLDFTSPDMDISLPQAGWRNQGTVLNLQLRDDLSGLYESHCLLEELSWLSVPDEEYLWFGEDYPAQIELDGEGAFLVSLHCEDVAGNVTEEEYGLYLQDFTPPIVSDCMLGGIGLQEGVNHVPYTETLLLSFHASDGLSGLEEVEYCFIEEGEPEESDWVNLSFTEHDDLQRTHEMDFEVALTQLVPSQCWIHIRLRDKAGNVSQRMFGPNSLEGIGCFRILTLSDPRWEYLFLDEEGVGPEILWRGLRLEDFLSLSPKNCIDQDMLPFYRNKDKQGFHPGYDLYASFLVNYPDYDKIVVEDRFYREDENGFISLDMILAGEQFQLDTEMYEDRISWISREEEGVKRIVLRYQIPANAVFLDALGGELTVQEVCNIRNRDLVKEPLVVLQICLEREGAELYRWLPDQSGQGLLPCWYGSSKRSEGLPQGALCWLSGERSAYGDLGKRFP